jgi:hypothetical protein
VFWTSRAGVDMFLFLPALISIAAKTQTVEHHIGRTFPGLIHRM